MIDSWPKAAPTAWIQPVAAFLLSILPTQRTQQGRKQLVGVEGFNQEVVHPRRHALCLVLGKGVGRYGDENYQGEDHDVFEPFLKQPSQQSEASNN